MQYSTEKIPQKLDLSQKGIESYLQTTIFKNQILQVDLLEASV